MKEETKLILQFNKKGQAYFQVVNRTYENGEVKWDFLGFISLKEFKRAYQNLIVNSKGDITNEN